MRRNVAGQETHYVLSMSFNFLSDLWLDMDRKTDFGQEWTGRKNSCPPHFSLLSSHFKPNMDRRTGRFTFYAWGKYRRFRRKTSKNKVSRLDSKLPVLLSTRRARRA